MALSDKSHAYVEKYQKPLQPAFPSSMKHVDTKILNDGHRLELTSGVSILEFPGTVAYFLRLDGQTAFLIRPESALISEAGYRTIMGLINSEGDFYTLQSKFEDVAKKLFNILRKTATEG